MPSPSKKTNNKAPDSATTAPPPSNQGGITPPPMDPTVVKVVMARPAQCGETFMEAGALLATVELAPEVSLNYLVDAVRNGLAREV